MRSVLYAHWRRAGRVSVFPVGNWAAHEDVGRPGRVEPVQLVFPRTSRGAVPLAEITYQVLAAGKQLQTRRRGRARSSVVVGPKGIGYDDTTDHRLGSRKPGLADDAGDDVVAATERHLQPRPWRGVVHVARPEVQRV